MRTARMILVSTLVLWGVGAVPALEIKKIQLADGRSERNTLDMPVVDASGLGSLAFGEFEYQQDHDTWVAYQMNGSLLTDSPKYWSPRYRLAASANLGARLEEAFRSEAAAMGFAVATRLDHPTVWRISGKIESFSVEIRPYAKHFGATGFYGFMQLAVEVRSPSGTSEMENIKLYGMHRFYNGGYGLRDEVKDCMGRFIIESAQETLARLNRKLFGARPHPEVETMLQALERTDKKIPPNRLHAIGLSGHPHAMGVLLDLLSDEKDVRTRRNLINALATLASPEAFESLSARYADEDEDCRYFILKAMEYIGSEETRGFVRERGTEDDDLACRRLVWHAERVGTH